MARLPNPETLEAYRALVEAADDIVLIADWDSARFVGANRVALDKLGYTMDELREMTGADLSQLPRGEHQRFSRELIESGETRVRGVPVRCKSGTAIHMDLWVKKYVANGSTYHVNVLREAGVPSSTNETFRRARGELLASEAFYRGIVTCTDDAVVISELDGGAVIEANPAACAMFGYGVDEWSSVVADDLHAEAERARLGEDRQHLEEEGVSHIGETILVRKDGTTFYADLIRNVLITPGSFDGDDRPLVVSLVRDVSVRREQAEQLQRSYEELSRTQTKLLHTQKLAAVGEVAAGVAHEVNNPAAFVLMNCDQMAEQVAALDRFVVELRGLAAHDRTGALGELLATKGFDVRALVELVADNREGIERIRSVTRDLRLFSRVEREEVNAVDLNDVVRGTIRLLSNELRHRARVELSLGELPTLAAERNKLAQVVTNLLLNAAQAIVEGAADANVITVTTASVGEEIVLSVRDSGVGMAEAVVEHIFEPFFTTKSSEQGTGLGLSLCAEIVKNHRGQILVSSVPARGSLLTVRLPHDTGLTLSAPPTKPAPRHSSGKKRVMVIDDDMGMVRAYRRMLRKFDATIVTSGAEALAVFERDDDFDLVICDLMMPEMDGPQVFEAMRVTYPQLVERVVFCTGGAFTPRAREFVASVTNEVLDKPLRMATIERLIA
jgi:PAS domain S-box-containing protein